MASEQWPVRGVRRLGLIAVWILTLAAPATFAQDAGAAASGDAEEAEEKQENKDVEIVVVTGSRLADLISGARVRVLDRSEIESRGLASVEDIVRSLPQSFSDINAAASLDNSLNSVDAIGQSAIDLRGLGSSNTLVLVNGRRWVQSSTFSNGTVNLNGIPFNAIERVEVLADGASAIYGADAQAGVINFLLRERYVGGETRIRQDMGANDGDIERIDQTLGTSWETGSIMASIGLSRSDAVDRAKAGLTTADFRSRGGTDQRTTVYGQPGFVGYGFAGGFFHVIPLGALPPGDDGTQGVMARLSPDNFEPFDFAAFDVQTGGTAVSDSLTGFLNVKQDFADGMVTAYGTLSYAKNESQTIGSALGGVYTVPHTNPYNDVPPRPPFTVNVGYVFANEVIAGLMPRRASEGSQTNTSFSVGAVVQLPFRDWFGDFSLSHAEEDAYFGFISPNQELLNQRLAGVDASGNPLPREQIINPFGDGSAQSPAAVDGLVELFTGEGPAAANTNTASQDDYLLTLGGSVFEMWGGASQLALGAELRTETLDYTSDQSRGTLFIVLKPEREVRSWFAEWSLPFVSESNAVPGIAYLGLKAAVRNDVYDFSGPFDGPSAPSRAKSFAHTSPKIDFSWRPIQALTVRGSWGESFVPPLTSRLFATDSGPFNWLPFTDPDNPGAGVLFPDVYFVGNPDLVPEVSENRAFGLTWEPLGFLQGLAVAVTRHDITIEDRIGRTSSLAFSQPELLFEIPGVIERTADGAIGRVNLLPVNIASRDSVYTDVEVSYGFDTVIGSFAVGGEGTHTGYLRDVSLPGADPVALHGTEGGPERVKTRTYVSLARGSLTLRLEHHYSSTYKNRGTKVGAYRTYDLTGTYRFADSGWDLLAGSRNLFDADFPFYNGFGTPWDPRRVDTRGRIAYLEIRKSYQLPFVSGR